MSRLSEMSPEAKERLRRAGQKAQQPAELYMNIPTVISGWVEKART